MLSMTLEQLRIFLAVAESLHFSRAADILYMTQPAVSAAIRSLESKYNIKLFHRLGRRVEITEAGKLLQKEAQKILEQVQLTERGLQELTSLEKGELKLGSSLTIGNYWLPEKISKFQHLYPFIFVNCSLANTEEICLGTATGKFDLALIEGAVTPGTQSYLEQEIIGYDHLKIVVGRFHPWFQTEKIYASQIIETEWIMRESGSGTQQKFQEALQSWGIDISQLNVILVLNTGEMVKAVVESGKAAAGISELMLTKELQLGTLKTIEVIDDIKNTYKSLNFVRPFLKIKHKQRFQTRLCQIFEKILIDNY